MKPAGVVSSHATIAHGLQIAGGIPIYGSDKPNAL